MPFGREKRERRDAQSEFKSSTNIGSLQEDENKRISFAVVVYRYPHNEIESGPASNMPNDFFSFPQLGLAQKKVAVGK
jgi:hypothetical protein